MLTLWNTDLDLDLDLNRLSFLSMHYTSYLRNEAVMRAGQGLRVYRPSGENHRRQSWTGPVFAVGARWSAAGRRVSLGSPGCHATCNPKAISVESARCTVEGTPL